MSFWKRTATMSKYSLKQKLFNILFYIFTLLALSAEILQYKSYDRGILGKKKTLNNISVSWNSFNFFLVPVPGEWGLVIHLGRTRWAESFDTGIILSSWYSGTVFSSEWRTSSLLNRPGDKSGECSLLLSSSSSSDKWTPPIAPSLALRIDSSRNR